MNRSARFACLAFLTFLAIHAHRGECALNPTPAWTAESNQANAQFGGPVSSAGDVNGDGYDDVIVGAAAYAISGQSSVGRAYVFHGSPSGPSVSPDWIAAGNQSATQFGISVSSAGDVNGDGYSDVIVGAWQYHNGQATEGGAFVYLGSATGLAPTAAWSVESNQVGAQMGLSVSGAGDVNGDGYDDVLVGAPQYDNGQTNEGRAYVYMGSSSGLAMTPAWFAESDVAEAQFGRAVSTAGDVNGDGYDDVVVTATSYLGTNKGAAFVYLGSASGLAATPVWTGSGDVHSSVYGISAASAGDINADGYDDLIVGDQGYNNGQTNEGRAWVYHGSASGPSVAPSWVTPETNQTTSLLGCSVSSAGDVNEDGYADVIIGAVQYANGESQEGAAFVYLGSASGLGGSAAWMGEGNQVGAFFGASVCGAGDVNGDGLDDVIVGARLYDNGESNEGRAFLYYGTLGSAPSVAGPSTVYAEEDGTVEFSVTASDADGDPITSLTADLSGLPAGNDATFVPGANNATGLLTWHPKPGMKGTYTVTFTAANALSGSMQTTIVVPPKSVTLLGVFDWIPAPVDIGPHVLKFKGKGSAGDTTTAVTFVDVLPGGGASTQASLARRATLAVTAGPAITAPSSVQVAAGATLEIVVWATNTDSLSVDATDLPSGGTAVFTADHDPAIAVPATRSAEPGSLLSFDVSASDPDGEPIGSLVADLSQLPPGHGASFDVNGSQTSGTFNWTPSVGTTGVYVVTFGALNGLVHYAPTVITVGSGLAGYWKLNGNGLDDAKGNALVPAGGLSFAAGQLSLAADVNGSTGGHLATAATPSFDVSSGGFTFEAWVKVRTLAYGGNPRIAFAGHEGTNEFWELYVCGQESPTGTAKVKLSAGGAVIDIQSSVVVADGLWHHVATTYDGGDVKLYVDGILDNSLAQPGLTITAGGGEFWLGDRPAGGSQFDGMLDEVRLWTRARTAAEINSSMNAERGYPTAVETASPAGNRLRQNRPNPFNPSTRIQFELAQAGRVRLEVFDVLGRHVASLVDRVLPAGPHETAWQGRDDGGRAVASGVYFYRLTSGGFEETRRMVLLE